jgi:hypothetical protein
VNNSNFYNNGNISNTIILYNNYPENTSNIIENSYLINDTGNYTINNKDINIDTLYRISYNNTVYFTDGTITFTIKDHNGNPVEDVRLYIEKPNGELVAVVYSDENGNANYTLDAIGKLSFNVYYYDNEFSRKRQKVTFQVNITVKTKISDIKLNKNYKSTRYSKINCFLNGQIISDYTGDLSGLKVIFKVYSGKEYKIYTEKTDSNGKVVFKIPKTLTAGNHKIEVITSNKIMKTTSVKIQKAGTIVKAPKVTVKFKKSKYFKVSIKNKETKKALSNVKVKIKVFSGKKFKTYMTKTDKKGIAKINTKNLKTGTHKVVISSQDNNYKIYKKSSIKIKR